MDSYRVEKKASMKIALEDDDAEIGRLQRTERATSLSPNLIA